MLLFLCHWKSNVNPSREIRMVYSRVLVLSLWQACVFHLIPFSIMSSIRNSNGPRLSVCKSKQDTSGHIALDCRLRQGYHFDFRDVRTWAEHCKDAKYSMHIRCDVGGTVYLPWPFQARNIVSLTVEGCKIEGFLSEMTVVHKFANELKTLVLSGVSIILPLRDMMKLNSNLQKVPWETDCGPLNLERLVLRDIRYDLKVSPEERDGLSPSRVNMPPNKHHKLGKPCVFSRLKYIDESGSRTSGRYHLQLIPGYSVFPKLEVYNMSRNELRHVPNEFRLLHSKKFPVLKHADFSNNNLRHFEFEFPYTLKKCTIEMIDLRNNRISTISPDTINRIKAVGSVFIDVRNNPLKCNCRLAGFKQYVDSQYRKSTDPDKKSIVSGITCQNGPFRPGQMNKVSLLDSKVVESCLL